MTSVLIVDDDQDIRQALRQALEEASYAIEEAADGAHALAILRAAEHGMVVLLDVMMPQMDGSAVVRVIADDDDLARRHAYVLITANIAAVPLEQARDRLRLGIPILQKPFNMAVLLDAVALASRRLENG